MMTRCKLLLVVTLGSLVTLIALGSWSWAEVSSPSLEKQAELYGRGKLFDGSYPKFFTFVTAGQNLSNTGAGSVHIKIKKIDPLTKKIQDELLEVRNVGEIIASSDRGAQKYNDGQAQTEQMGKILLSTGDEVIVHFTVDLATLVSSKNYGDSGLYFGEFPIYAPSYQALGSIKGQLKNMGKLYKYKGTLAVVAQIEGLDPRLLSYAARITYAEDAVELNDRVFIFIPLNP